MKTFGLFFTNSLIRSDETNNTNMIVCTSHSKLFQLNIESVSCTKCYLVLKTFETKHKALLKTVLYNFNSMYTL